jgi:hypothetical protein
MKFVLAAGLGFALLFSMSIAVRPAHGQADSLQAVAQSSSFVAPKVFQAAGPSGASIQSSIDQYVIELGVKNNTNDPGPLTSGHREINWDGGSKTNQSTSETGNPMTTFLVTRGALFTTPDGTGFVQAPPSADPILFPPGGLAGRFNNPTYGDIFSAFSPSRLFSPIGSNITDVEFFQPGGGNLRATTTGFGAIFSDVDLPDGSGPGEKQGNRKSSTLVEFYDAQNQLLFSSFVPAAPGNKGQSFFGIVFPDARIARVRITAGNVLPGADDGGKQDVVMMDDFFYGEPQAILP